MMNYCGIDPSTKCGFVKINENGEVVTAIEITSKVKEDPQRFMDIADKVVKQLEPNDMICIEGFSFGSKGAGVSIQYGIGWQIRAEMVRNEYTYYEVPPTSVKKFATGKGNVKKDEMVLPIYKKYGFEHPSDNVRDALILAKMAEGIYNPSKLLKYEQDALEKVRR